MKRSNSSARWLCEHANDFYVKQAKQLGYRSRAAFKLLEILEKDKQLLHSGMRVIDLGAAPGSWAMAAKNRLGQKGRVIAVDLLPMEPVEGVEFIQGDFTEEQTLSQLLAHIDNCPIDLVMSDMAPNMSGMVAVDQPRSMHLAELALALAMQVLRPGGHFLVKVFQGSGSDEFLKELKKSFSQVKIRKPKASRSRSNEIYFVGMGFINTSAQQAVNLH